MDCLERIVVESNFKGDSRLAAHALFSAMNGTMISFAKYPGRTMEEIKHHTLQIARLIADQFESEQSAP